MIEILLTILFLGGIVYIAYNTFLFALWLLKKIFPALVLLMIVWIALLII